MRGGAGSGARRAPAARLRADDRSLGSSLVDGPAVEGGELAGRLGLRLVLHDRQSDREGVNVGDALA